MKNKRYIIKDRLILKKNQILLVPNLAVREKVLQILHNIPLAGDPAVVKIYQAVWERFTWKGLKNDIYKYILECMQSQENKEGCTKPIGFLQSLPIPQHKWEDISMDFITGLPKVQGKDIIVVVVDRLTKFIIPIIYTTS